MFVELTHWHRLGLRFPRFDDLGACSAFGASRQSGRERGRGFYGYKRSSAKHVRSIFPDAGTIATAVALLMSRWRPTRSPRSRIFSSSSLSSSSSPGVGSVFIASSSSFCSICTARSGAVVGVTVEAPSDAAPSEDVRTRKSWLICQWCRPPSRARRRRAKQSATRRVQLAYVAEFVRSDFESCE